MRVVSRIAWALLCVVIVRESLGTWGPGQPAVWAPTLISIHDVAENVFVYVVFGVLGVLSMRDAYRRHWMRLVIRVTALALLFSACNEALQLYTIDRVASLTDIASAFIGSIAGGTAVSVLIARPPR